MVKLGDVINVHYGKALKADQRVSNGSVHVFGSSGIVGNHDKTLCSYPTIIIGRKGSVGAVTWAPDGGWIIDTAYFIEIKDNNKLDLRYLFHTLSGIDLTKKTITTSIPGLNRDDLYDTLIKLPSFEEQKRIADILDKADGICQKREQAIKLADDFLRATFLEIFPQLDDCGNRVKLGDIVTLDAPMVDPREDKFIDLIHIGPDRIEKNTGLLLSALTAREENLISKKFLFDENYVLYSKIRPYLKKCAIPDFGGLCSADMYPVKPISGKTNREFIWQLLLSDFFTKYTETLPDRANIPKLNRKELLSFELSLPSIPLQEKYKAIVQKTNRVKLIMRKQNDNSMLNKLADELFSTN
ncbi:restriction endonuclease subunit S [Salmonella enterica subsp. enterica serovar Oranienburg]|nr:restriction endonuclease subunit S [Salmonella enterica subsp. enterica serovar Oranienburg]